MVDDIRIGSDGYALVVAPDGALIAHGDPDKKALVAQSRQHRRPPALAAAPGDPPLRSSIVDDGRPTSCSPSRRRIPSRSAGP